MIRVDTISPPTDYIRNETKKLDKSLLAHRQFVTEAGKLTAEGVKIENEKQVQTFAFAGLDGLINPKKKQVVETTCGSHEKTSRDSLTKPGKLPLKKLFPPGEIS